MENKTENELIAEFMGEEISAVVANPGTPVRVLVLPRKPLSDFKTGRPIETKYSTSWDWLMPVVEKIESLGYGFHKSPFDLDVVEYLSGDENKIIASQDDPKLKLIQKWHYVVIEFIKWHNNHGK